MDTNAAVNAATKKTIDFNGQILAVVKKGDEPFVPMRPIVEGMELTWPSQQQKLLNQQRKFSCNDIVTTGKDGKNYKMLCLPLMKLPGWLFTINPLRCRKEIRPKIEKYQDECSPALWDFWTKGFAVNDNFVSRPMRPNPFYRALNIPVSSLPWRYEAGSRCFLAGSPELADIRNSPIEKVLDAYERAYDETNIDAAKVQLKAMATCINALTLRIRDKQWFNVYDDKIRIVA
jgi:hypothetical protein